MSVRLSFDGATGPGAIEVRCRDSYHRETRGYWHVTFRSEERWDGAGRYWTTPVPMSIRERERWEDGEGLPGRDRNPRAMREKRQNGFYWLRDGKPVTDERNAKLISNAYFHNAGPLRQGPPIEGILDGVTRHFESRRCSCGAGGIRARGDVVEGVLDALAAGGVVDVSLEFFRRAIETHRA